MMHVGSSRIFSQRWTGQLNFPSVLVLALDPFQIPTNENNILNLTEGNIAVIPCELPKGNPKPIPIFSLDNNRIEIESNSSKWRSLFRRMREMISSCFVRSIQSFA